MARRLLWAAAALLAAGLALALAPGGAELPEGITVGASYSGGSALISYEDAGASTERVVLEVLGMRESFRREMAGPSFEVGVPFDGEPEFGWAAHPVVLEIYRPGHDTLFVKTEIRPAGEEPAPVIVTP
ncbi:MAG: hypothetical protein MPJ05_00755 [Nitrosopumilus sp.]|nr:hypothetical protein [Nitrosopumilus sp.]